MRRIGSQIIVAVVCCILGFMLTYQFKMLTKYQKKENVTKSATDITVEIEMYKKEKTEMQKKIDELQGQIKSYEEAAVKGTESSKEILAELERSRMLTGATDVEGPGLIIYLKPDTSDILGSNIQKKKITDFDLVLIINELRFAGAEAIAVNGYRVTSRTGIKITGGVNTYITLDGKQKVSQDETITITAIGKKELLNGALSFKGTLSFMDPASKVDYEKSDKIKIAKSNMPIKFEYAKPVK